MKESVFFFQRATLSPDCQECLRLSHSRPLLSECCYRVLLLILPETIPVKPMRALPGIPAGPSFPNRQFNHSVVRHIVVILCFLESEAQRKVLFQIISVFSKQKVCVLSADWHCVVENSVLLFSTNSGLNTYHWQSTTI